MHATVGKASTSQMGEEAAIGWISRGCLDAQLGRGVVVIAFTALYSANSTEARSLRPCIALPVRSREGDSGSLG